MEIALAGEKTFGLKSSRDTAIHPLWVCFYHTRHIISVIKSKPGLVKSSVTCPLFPPPFGQATFARFGWGLFEAAVFATHGLNG